jgi:hemerythrin-like domain-containing protein
MPIAKQSHINLNKAAFAVWEHQTLVDFCYAAEAKLQEQDDRIQQLQCDLKDAIQAYRELIKRHD